VIVLLVDSNGNVIRTLRGKLGRGRILTVPVPAVPLGGGKEAALVSFELNIAKAGSKRKPWARAPKTCPKRGWSVQYAPLFNTLGRVKLTDRTNCR